MFKLMRKSKKGFTLIELIVVIAILAILAAIAIPTFTNMTKEANEKVAVANARNIATAFNAYNALNPSEDGTPTLTDVSSSQSTLTTAGLWPSGLAADDVSAALGWIEIDGNGVAVIKETAPAG